jgi:hypothetical protein
MPERKPPNYAKVATVFSVIMLLSIGLCGVSIYTKSPNEYFSPLGVASLFGFLGSIVGLFLTGVSALLEDRPYPRKGDEDES